MKEPDFEIQVSDFRSTFEEYQQAMRAPESELPVLSKEQIERAHRLGTTPEHYARTRLAELLGNRRQREKARRLGEEAKKALAEAGPAYKLRSVVWQESKNRWLLAVETPARVLGVPIPFELADEALDAAVLRQIEYLRETVLEGIGRIDLAKRTAQ